jgi:hypothetical protein
MTLSFFFFAMVCDGASEEQNQAPIDSAPFSSSLAMTSVFDTDFVTDP